MAETLTPTITLDALVPAKAREAVVVTPSNTLAVRMKAANLLADTSTPIETAACLKEPN